MAAFERSGRPYQMVETTTALVTDSYSETGQDSDEQLYSGGNTAVGQSITGDGRALMSATFYLRKVGSPTGDMVAKLYAHSGTFGTSSVPDGDPLATSAVIAASRLGVSYALTTFVFDGSVSLDSGVYYVIVLEYAHGDASNRVEAGYDASAPSHGGNKSDYSGSWAAAAGEDLCFYVRGPADQWETLGTTKHLIVRNTHATEDLTIYLSRKAMEDDEGWLLAASGGEIALEVEVCRFWTRSQAASSFLALVTVRP